MKFDFQNNLKKLFGFHCDFEYPLSQSGMGISISGIDLSKELKPNQVDPFDYDVISPLVDKIISDPQDVDSLEDEGYSSELISDILKKVRI